MNIFKNETTEIETAKLLLIDFIDTFERLPEDSKKYFVENINKVYGYKLSQLYSIFQDYINLN